MKKSGLLFLLCGFLLCTAGCTTAVMAGKTAVNYATEDRNFSSSVEDNRNEISLRNDLFQKNHTYPVDVSLVMSENRLLIVGELETEADIDAVLYTVWNNPAVQEVYNHLKLKDDDDIIDVGADFLLNKNVWAVLVKTENVTAANYKMIVHDKILYVIGSTSSAEEKQKALAALKTAIGLRKIVEYINII